MTPILEATITVPLWELVIFLVLNLCLMTLLVINLWLLVQSRRQGNQWCKQIGDLVQPLRRHAVDHRGG